MAKVRSIDFLPESFKSKTNEKFLNATLDQLIQEPELKASQGYIGRKTAPSSLLEDGYKVESTKTRENYQLEPGIVFNNSNDVTVDILSYPGLISGMNADGSHTNDHNRLFQSETYGWAPLIDFDKFVNYSQYFWLPLGPNTVPVTAEADFSTSTFNVIRDEEYTLTGFTGGNPTISVIRGQEYRFNLNQDGHEFYIQAAPGTSGTMPWSNNISSRDVLGVSNNGEDDGTVVFNVPDATAQDFFHTLTDDGIVDLVTEARFDSISNQLLSTVNDIDGITSLHLKTIVFINDDPGSTEAAGWVYTIGDMNPANFLNLNSERYQVFQIHLDYSANPSDPTIVLQPFQQIEQFHKFQVDYGNIYSNVQFFKNNSGFIERIPVTTASLDELYYQDANDPSIGGVINVLDEAEAAILDINLILGKKTYTSPNGVIFTNGLRVYFDENVEQEEYRFNDYYVEGVGREIRLVAVKELLISEAYTVTLRKAWDAHPYDTSGFDESLNAPYAQDYMTINRSSLDKNGWSRSNRWFHIDVILETAKYNNTLPELDNVNRAKRPIIEFEADLNLHNYGTLGKKNIDLIDFNTTDALSDIHGQEAGYMVDGYELLDGVRIVFTNDPDITVRNKIFVVDIEDINSNEEFRVNLRLADDGEVENNDVITVLHGDDHQGKVFSYKVNEWVESQAKIQANQPPLFNIYDTDGTEIGDQTIYPGSSFEGTKLFSYAIGNGIEDPVIGFPLKFLNIDNLGDIVFENNLFADTFSFVSDSTSTDNTGISIGVARKYSSRVDFENTYGWVKTIEDMLTPQVLSTLYDGTSIAIDINPSENLEIPPTVLNIKNEYVSPTDYTINNKVITLNDPAMFEKGSYVEVRILSEEVSKSGYYAVPENISRNGFNENTSELTLGTVRNHFLEMTKNILDLEGIANGSNNSRDLGDISSYGNVIIQHSAPAALPAMFMRKKEYNFHQSVVFNSKQYEKFKNQLVDWIGKNDVYDKTPTELLDAAIKSINFNKNINNSFYWSDMLAFGDVFDRTKYIITAISSETFTTLKTYDYTQANNAGLLVTLNGRLLIKDLEYTVADDGPRIDLLIDTEIDDILLIDEYTSTAGSMIPSTPSKMGLYQKFVPVIAEDTSYATPTMVIRGHDGSITIANGDISDDVLLEFEKRIYNNIKINSESPLKFSDIMPGHFRDTQYSVKEINELISPSLLAWSGLNRIDLKTQTHLINEPKTYNYRTATGKFSDEPLAGHWRGIYNYYYDTDAPHKRPWEMLGLTEKPLWWELRYGAAPYTSGNLVLWDDIEEGLYADPTNPKVFPEFARPGLSELLPVDEQGKLLLPIDTVISGYTALEFEQSWLPGDQGPAETSWRKSSQWPFAVQTILALAKPAQYYSLMVDRDRYKYDETSEQYLYDERGRLDSRNIDLLGEMNPKHSYINWIIEYNKHHGYESADQLAIDMSNLNVKLCHPIGSFTNKESLKIFTDKSSPDSTNSSLLLPDESFKLLMYKNQPTQTIVYSSVVVQIVKDGYQISGNSPTDPFFKIYTRAENNRSLKVNYGTSSSPGSKIDIPQKFSDKVELIPYGTLLPNKQAVVNFLIGYGKHLEHEGIIFETFEGANPLNWEMMAKEFAIWDDQGWIENSTLNLNPAATSFEFEREGYVVNDLTQLPTNEQPLDISGAPLDISNYVVDRLGNNFNIRTIDGAIFSYLKFNITQFENMLVLDNTSIFNDLIYDPVTGVRQHRVKIRGHVAKDWTGVVNIPGFMFNDDNVDEWIPNVTYKKGVMVQFKNSYWSATEVVHPTTEFDFEKWVEVDYANINKGMLPNLATKSDQQLDFYNNKVSNLESDIDLFSLGLIGFNSREYLTALDLDDTSQVSIYSGMLSSKGTTESLELFQDVVLNKESVDYDIFENWAIKRAEYGATGSKAYFEVVLDENDHTTNPSVIQIATNPVPGADQNIHPELIFKQNKRHISGDILPLRLDKNLDTSLPSAGFVTEDEVDFSLYDISDIGTVANGVADGNLIWIAKDTDADWNVYRVDELTPKLICGIDNLDGTLTLEFDGPHNLMSNSRVIVQNFDEFADGSYKIISVLDNTITVPGALDEKQLTVEEVEGTVYKLNTTRLKIPSDIKNSLFNNLGETHRVWIDETKSRRAIFDKANPFTAAVDITPPEILSELADGFGHTMEQGRKDTGLIVGAPERKRIFCYDNVLGGFKYNTILYMSGTQHKRYGESLSLIENWGVAGAPGNNSTPGIAAIIRHDTDRDVFFENQILTVPGASSDTKGFGTVLKMSHDENWAYVSEPEDNQVHVYKKKLYQHQEFIAAGDGIVTTYDISDKIIVDNANELEVTVNGTLESGWTLVGNEVIFDTPPVYPSTVLIVRKRSNTFTGDYSQTSFPLTGLYGYDGMDSIKVHLNAILLRPHYDYYMSGNNLIFIDPPPTPDFEGIDNISVDLINHFTHTATITKPEFVGDLGNEMFGAQLDFSIDHNHIMISAPNQKKNGTLDVGMVFIYDRVIERFVVDTDGDDTFTSVRDVEYFKVNGIEQLSDSIGALNSTYNLTGKTATLHDSTLVVGDTVDFETSEFILVQVLAGESQDDHFGSTATLCDSKCAAYIKTENKVVRFINESKLLGHVESVELVPREFNPTFAPGDTIRVNFIEVPVGDNIKDLVDNILLYVTPNVTARLDENKRKIQIELVNQNIRSIYAKLDIGPGIGDAFNQLGLELYTPVQEITSFNTSTNFGKNIEISGNYRQLIISSDEGLNTFDILENVDEFAVGTMVYGHFIDSDNNDISYVEGKLLVADKPNHTVKQFNNPGSKLSWEITKLEQVPVNIELINTINLYNKDSRQVEQYLDYIDPLNGKILSVAQQNIDFYGSHDPTIYDEGHNGSMWGNKQIDQIWWDTSKVRFIDYNVTDARYASKLWGKLFPGSSVDVYQWTESNVIPSEYAGTAFSDDLYITETNIGPSGLDVNTYYFWAKGSTDIKTKSNKKISVSSIAHYIENPVSSGISYAAFLSPGNIALYNCKRLIQNTDTILHVGYDAIKNDNNIFVEYDLLRENHPRDFLSDGLYKKFLDSMVGADQLGNNVPDPALSPNEMYGIDFRPRQTMFVNRRAALRSYFLRVNQILKTTTVVESRIFPLLNSKEDELIDSQYDKKVSNYAEIGFQDLELVPVGYTYFVESDETHRGIWVLYAVVENNGINILKIIASQTYDTSLFWNYTDWYSDDFSTLDRIDLTIDSVGELVTLDQPLKTVVKVNANSVDKWEIYRLGDAGWARVALEDGTIEFSEELWHDGNGQFGWDAEIYDSSPNAEEPVIELRNIIKSINEELLITDLAIERNAAIISVFNYILAEQPTVDWIHKSSLIDVNHKIRSLAQYDVYQKDNQDYLIDYINEAKPYHTKINEFILNYDGLDIAAISATDFDLPSVWNADLQQFISPRLTTDSILLTEGGSNYDESAEIWQQPEFNNWFENYKLNITEAVVTNPGTGYTVSPIVTVTGNSTRPAILDAQIFNGSLISLLILDPGEGYTETPIVTITAGNGTGATAILKTGNNLVRTMTTTIKYDRFAYESKIVDWNDNDNMSTKNLFYYPPGNDAIMYRVVELNEDTVFNIAKYEVVTVDDLDTVEQMYLRNGLPQWEENDNNVTHNFVRYNNRAYHILELNNDTSFDPVKYTPIEPALLGGIDRTSGYYVADVESPGLDLSLLIDGISFPGVAVTGQEYDTTVDDDVIYESIFPGSNPEPILATELEVGTTYVITTLGDTDFTLVGALTNTTSTTFTATSAGIGTGTATEATGGLYSLTQYSDSLATYIGTRPTDIDVHGGEYIDSLHSHAPEELVPCSIFDTVDIKIFSRPGADYENKGYAYKSDNKIFDIHLEDEVFDFWYISKYPVVVKVVNTSTGKTLYEDINYTVDWPAGTVNVTSGTTVGERINIFVYEIGGGYQILRKLATGAELNLNEEFNSPANTTLITGDNTIITVDLTKTYSTQVAVAYDDIYDMAIFHNGKLVDSGTYALVPDNVFYTKVYFTHEILDDDVVTITVFGHEDIQHEENYLTTQTYTKPQFLNIDIDDTEFTTRNNHNMIVELNGLRQRGAEGIRHIGDGAQVDFTFPLDSDIIQSDIAYTEIDAYNGDVLLTQGIDYTVNPGSTVEVSSAEADAEWDSDLYGFDSDDEHGFDSTYTFDVFTTIQDPRIMTFFIPPADGDKISIYVASQKLQYNIVGDEIIMDPPANEDDIVSITTFNDTSQLNILTQVFVGPKIISFAEDTKFDNKPWDSIAESGWDALFGYDVFANEFAIDVESVTNLNSLWVTYNGKRLLAGTEYEIVNDNILILAIPLIEPTDEIIVTSITDNVVEDGVSYRLFKDMRDNVGMYAINESTTTVLTQELFPTDEVIHVNDASVLGQPDLSVARFGIVIIDGERITYRERDLDNNTITGLFRGTAGTAISPYHSAGETVHDVSVKSLVQWDYDKIWYEQGDGTASNGVPLNEQTTFPALFIKN